MEPLSIYFHWPYCKSKCPYCDFFKIVKKDVRQQEIIDSYMQDLDYYHNLVPNRIVRSVFFGGGTPSLIEPKYIEKLLNYIDKLWPEEKNIEISLEANPNSYETHRFQDFKTAGINRLSLGVQALNQESLKFFGRTHTLTQALQSIEEVVKIFDNHSMDLIYARPTQTLDEWLVELKQAVNFGLKHLSLYQLTIEEGTIFEKKGIKALNEDKAAQMYIETVHFLRQNGYPRYEVSNFAPQNFESKHNKCYWLGDDYIGIGQSAHGRLKIDGKPMAFVDPRKVEVLTKEERAEELIIMGLRLQQGISKKHFSDVADMTLDDFINQNNLKELVLQGMIENTQSHLKATDQGFLFLNQLIEKLCV